MVIGICDPNKSRARDHTSLKLGLKWKYLNIKNSSSNKFLTVLIINNLNINKHVSKLCKAASSKLHAFARISKYDDDDDDDDDDLFLWYGGPTKDV